MVSPKDVELRFAPAPEGWQQDVAWQVFGFEGDTQPPQFFYRIPDDEAEAKALIESISRSALVGRVQLLDARLGQSPSNPAEGPVVVDVHGAWEVQWQGMGRSAPWIQKADSHEVLQSMIQAAGASQKDSEVPILTTGALDPDKKIEPQPASELVLGINVPLREIERHAVGRGTLENVRER